MPQAKVLTFEEAKGLEAEVQAKCAARRIDAAEAFDNLIADYKAAEAACLHSSNEKTWNKTDDKRQDLLWEIIATPAPLARHIGDKIGLLCEMLGEEFTDCRQGSLLESIRHDVRGLE
jgi:hypothetical protein